MEAYTCKHWVSVKPVLRCSFSAAFWIVSAWLAGRRRKARMTWFAVRGVLSLVMSPVWTHFHALSIPNFFFHGPRFRLPWCE